MPWPRTRPNDDRHGRSARTGLRIRRARDRALEALLGVGGDHRVHVHVAGAALHAPHRHVRRDAGARDRVQRRDPRRGHALRARRPLARERALRGRTAAGGSDGVRRTWHRVGVVPAVVDREGATDGVHRPGRRAPGLWRLLPGRRAAELDAGALHDLARDLRDPGHARGSARRRRPDHAVARGVARARGRRRLGAARTAALRRGRAVREAHRSSEAERMTNGLHFRDATLDDATFYADVFTALRPTRPTDPVVERYWWEQPDDTYVSRRWVVQRHGRDIGVATFDHPAWARLRVPHGDIGGDLSPDRRDRATLGALLAEMERRLVAEGARRVAVRANEDDELRIATILARGFHEDRRHRRWLLDLGENGTRIAEMATESRARMRAEGIRVLTLDQDADPDTYRKVWRMNEEAVQDVPTTLPNVEETFEDTMRWLRAPDMHEDRIWLAREGDDIVGVSVLGYPPVRGVVGTAWTATARRVRGRGIARALKCETLVQAIALGVDRVQTGNDGANDPILHINASMGYRPWVGAINFLKDVPAG